MSIKTLRNYLVPRTRAWVVGLTLSALVVTASTLLVMSQPPVVRANGSAGQGNMTGNVIIDPNAVFGFENLQSVVVLTATFSCILPQGWVPFKLGINLTLQQTIGNTTTTYEGTGDTGSNIPPPTTCNGASSAPVEVTVSEDIFNPDVQQFQAGKAIVTFLTFPYTECSTIANGKCYDQTMGLLSGFSPTTVTLSAPSDYSGSNYSGANLSGQNLSGKNMQDALFNGTNFQGANLSGVNALNASFQNANLTGANLARAMLQGANFQGAELANATLTGANLQDANLTNADLTGANLKGTNLTNANLQGATTKSNTNFNSVIWSNTTCPDGTNSTANGGTCFGHL